MWPFRTKPTQAARVEPRATVPATVRNGLNDPEWLGTQSDQAVVDFFRGYDQGGTFGPPVSEQTAMKISVVFACVDLMAGLVSGAPLGVYRDSPNGGRDLARNHKLFRFLNASPRPGRPLTSADWRRLWVYHVLLWGNHYSAIRYDNAARVIGFEPIMPWCVEVARQPDGTNLYIVRDNGVVREVIRQEDMLHFKGPSFDGVAGVSRIRQFARDPVALAATLEEQTGRVHENAARPSGMVTLPPRISPEGKKRFEEFFRAGMTGRHNAGNVLFADHESEWTALQLSPEDLGTIEARKFQANDICRFFKTPPHMVGLAADTSAWGSGIEQLTLGYKSFTLHPELVNFEQELAAKLFLGTEFYPSFDRGALVVMDAKTTAEVAQTEIQSGVLTINERRHQLQRPPVDGGDAPLVNSTMIGLDRALNPPAPAAQPAGNSGPPGPKDPTPAKEG